MINLPITTLYNIFNHPKRQLTNHNLAYQVINYGFKITNNDNIFMLLPSLDGTKLCKEYLEDSFLSLNIHNNLMPNINITYLCETFEEHKEMKKQIENLLASTNRQEVTIKRLTNVISVIEKSKNLEIKNLQSSIEDQNKQISKYHSKLNEMTKIINDQSTTISLFRQKHEKEIQELKNVIKTQEKNFSSEFSSLKNDYNNLKELIAKSQKEKSKTSSDDDNTLSKSYNNIKSRPIKNQKKRRKLPSRPKRPNRKRLFSNSNSNSSSSSDDDENSSSDDEKQINIHQLKSKKILSQNAVKEYKLFADKHDKVISISSKFVNKYANLLLKMDPQLNMQNEIIEMKNPSSSDNVLKRFTDCNKILQLKIDKIKNNSKLTKNNELNRKYDSRLYTNHNQMKQPNMRTVAKRPVKQKESDDDNSFTKETIKPIEKSFNYLSYQNQKFKKGDGNSENHKRSDEEDASSVRNTPKEQPKKKLFGVW